MVWKSHTAGGNAGNHIPNRSKKNLQRTCGQCGQYILWTMVWSEPQNLQTPDLGAQTRTFESFPHVSIAMRKMVHKTLTRILHPVSSHHTVSHFFIIRSQLFQANNNCLLAVNDWSKICEKHVISGSIDDLSYSSCVKSHHHGPIHTFKYNTHIIIRRRSLDWLVCVWMEWNGVWIYYVQILQIQ